MQAMPLPNEMIAPTDATTLTTEPSSVPSFFATVGQPLES
jgi:hypothetical protein